MTRRCRPLRSTSTIAREHRGAPTDISGVGYLVPELQERVHSRDGLGHGRLLTTSTTSRSTPSTSRPRRARSTRRLAVRRRRWRRPAASTARDRGRLQRLPGGRRCTDELAVRVDETATTRTRTRKCLIYAARSRADDLNYRPLPYGDSSVTVYTDEHGEAEVNYVPGLGMYFDNLGAIKNVNGGCDLENIDPIGTANVNVTARYPYQPVTAPGSGRGPGALRRPLPVPQDPRGLREGPGHAERQRARSSSRTRRTSTARRSRTRSSAGGQQGAGDCISSRPAAPAATSSTRPARWSRTSTPTRPRHGYFNDPFSRSSCTTTDEHGNTAIEVFNSEGTTVDVMAEWMNEVIFRDIPVSFGAPGRPGQHAAPTAAPSRTSRPRRRSRPPRRLGRRDGPGARSTARR